MKRTVFNFWIDLVSALSFYLLTLTGLLIYYILPPCGDCTGQRTACQTASALWGLSRHDYGLIHFYLALTSVVLVILHTALHWSWVWKTCCNLMGINPAMPDRQNMIGVFFLVVLIVTTIGLLLLAKLQAV